MAGEQTNPCMYYYTPNMVVAKAQQYSLQVISKQNKNFDVLSSHAVDCIVFVWPSWQLVCHWIQPLDLTSKLSGVMQEMAPNFIQHLLHIGDNICSLDVLFDELILQAGNHIVQYNWGKAGSCHGSSQGKVISRLLPMPN